MSIEGQGHFFTIYFPGFICFVLYNATISGERLQDHWLSGFINRIKRTVFVSRDFSSLMSGSIDGPESMYMYFPQF